MGRRRRSVSVISVRCSRNRAVASSARVALLTRIISDSDLVPDSPRNRVTSDVEDTNWFRLSHRNVPLLSAL